MILDQSCAPTFAAHQTFHPRFGWIKKGFDAARIDSSVFTSEDAPLRLGVGKNMVDAIRFWCNAFGVLTKSSTTSRGKVLADVPTNFGEALIGPDGLDPYMEDPSTLWVLHWRALSAPSLLPVWWLLFNRFSGREFTQEDVMRFIQDEIDAANWTQPNPSSLLKDVDCLIRMYSMRDARGRQTIDDLLDSPFREMGLLVSASQPGAYRLVLGQKPALSSAAVAFACADYIANALVGAQTCSLTKLLTDFGSPGKVFALTEDSLTKALTEQSELHNEMSLAAPGGSLQLVIDADPAALAQRILVKHHHRRGIKSRDLSRAPLSGSNSFLSSTVDTLFMDLETALAGMGER